MADMERTVAILFRGVDEMSGPMAGINNNLSTLTGRLESATAPMATIAGNAEKLSAALVVLAAGGMVAAVSAAGTFETGLNTIHTLIRDEPANVALFDAALEKYAATSTQSITDINAAVYQAISANIDYKEAIQFVTAAEILAVAGQATLKESVDLLSGTMSAYGASTEQAGKYSDVFFKTVEIGKLTIPELSGSLAKVTPIAAAVKIPIDELGAAMAALTANNQPANEAAEALRQIITNLIDPSKEARVEFDTLGIAFGASAINASGLSGKIAEIYSKSGGDPDKLTKMFGEVNALTGVLTLGSDSSGLYAKGLTDIGLAAGSAELAYSKMVGNIENVNQRFINTMQLALVSAGKPLLDDWAGIASGLSALFYGVKLGLDAGAFDEIYGAIDTFSTDFGQYLKDVGAAIPDAMKDVDFTAFLAAITGMGDDVAALFKALFGDFDLTKPADAAAAIQKVVDSVTKLVEFTSGIAEQLKPFATEMGKWINEALAADTETAKLAGSIAGMGQAINTMLGFASFVAPALAVFSGALVIDAVATLGTLVLSLAALPAAPAIAAAAAVAGLATGAGLLYTAYKDADDAVAALNKTLASTESVSQAVETLKSYESGLSSAKDAVVDLSDCVTSFPADFKITATSDTEAAAQLLNELKFDMDAFPPKTVLDFIARKQGIDELELQVKGLPTLTQLTVDAKLENADYISNFMSEVGKDKNANIVIDITQKSREKYTSEMQEIVNPDGTKTWVNVGVNAASLKETQDALKEIPTEKFLEIKLQGEIDKELTLIKTNAETVQKSMEWTAKINIAGIEAEAKKLTAAFESTASIISSVSDEISELFKSLPDSEFQFGAREQMAAIEQAMKIQLESFNLNKLLIEQQIELTKAKTWAIKAGDALIKINSSGLEPALEAIMWQILQKVQLAANESAVNFLLGI